MNSRRPVNSDVGRLSTLMDKQQASWLIVRAFGVYLLIQAFLLGLAIFHDVYMYSRLASSLEAQNVYVTSMIRSYRDSMFSSLLKFLVLSATGIYFLRGGRFLMRWLQYAPGARTDANAQTISQNLTEQEARNMSVNERLSAAGLFHEFADAVDRRDVPELNRILRRTYLPSDEIEAVIAEVLGTRGNAQQIVGPERGSRVS
jgi:hypothetical protein